MKTQSLTVLLFVLAMIAQSVLILTWGEPYPSIALPRVAGTINNQYDTLRTRQNVFVVETRTGAKLEMSASEIFNDAPPNIRSTIPAYLREHLQYGTGTFLDVKTKNRVRDWLVSRAEAAGVTSVQKIYGITIETHHPICERCDRSEIVQDTLSSTLLVNTQ